MAHILGDQYDLCIQPLKGADPMGQDPKYEDSFSELKGEIGNIDSGTTDWKKVETLAVQVLTTQAKDLNSAAYLCVALFLRHGYAGLADGIGILHHLVENHWAGMYPKSEKARRFTFEWLANRLSLFLATREVKEDEIPLLAPIADDLQALQGSAREQAKKYKPSFGELGRALAQKITEHQLEPSSSEPQGEAPSPVTSPAASAQPDSPASAEPAPAAAVPTPAPKPAASSVPARTTVEIPPQEPLASDASTSEIRNRLRGLVAPLRQSNPLSILPYRLLRSLKWDDLKGPPAADVGSGKTKIDSPRVQQRKALETLYEKKKWPTLVEVSEAAFQDGKGTYWLDLQFYTATALEELDPTQGARVAAFVRDELRQLLERFPGLPRLTFKDESPFANQHTRRWIEEAVVKMEVDVVGGRGGRVEEAVLSEEDLAKANALFEKKKPVQALEVLQAGVRKAGSRRSAFHARLTSAQLCLQANHFTWAKGLLEDLGKEMEAFRFELWEPETAVQVYHLLALCYGRLLNATKSDDAKEALAEAMAEIQGRLVRLDLPTVAKIEEALGPKGETRKGGLGRLFGLS